MGTDYTAIAVIGHPVELNELYEPPVLEKTFQHDYGQDVKFHPRSGRPLWKEVRRQKSFYDPDDETIGPYDLYCGTDDRILIVGIEGTDDTHSNCGPSESFVSLPENLEGDRLQLKAFFEECGLTWDDEKFGLWAILYCSY